MLIIAGHLQVAPELRDDYLDIANVASRQARDAPGCLDFVQAPDPLVPGRIVVLERWESENDLLAFRSSDPGGETAPMPDILDAAVRRYQISAVGDP